MADVTETQTASLTDFLLARIAEDEADAGRETWGQPIPGDCWGPDRVLAECEAHRQIVALHSDDADAMCQSYAGNYVHEPCPTLRAIALPHADHPDYRAEWRP